MRRQRQVVGAAVLAALWVSAGAAEAQIYGGYGPDGQGYFPPPGLYIPPPPPGYRYSYGYPPQYGYGYPSPYRYVLPQDQYRRNFNTYQQQRPRTKKAPAGTAPGDATAFAGGATGTGTGGGPVDCTRAQAIVSGYGFSDVSPARCSGKVFSFNATRDGKSCSVGVSAATGEITEVRKQP